MFISSHHEVRDEIHNAIYKGTIQQNQVALVYPDLDLYNEWVKNLQNRYDKDKSDKNLRALEFARDNFKESVNYLKLDTWAKHIVIHEVPKDGYNLEFIIKLHIREDNIRYFV